jgi:CxxC motif-containing protein
MIRKLTCIECPESCSLTVDIENCRVVKVEGNKCPKGEAYATTEVENPLRVLTGTVLAKGLGVKMVPVRTDKPIPKVKIPAAAAEIKKIRVTSSLRVGDVIVSDFLGLGVNLVAAREVTG